MSFGKTNYRTGGTRGGADQFKWDDVKNDKYRENYLGHSVHAPVGRWQKGKDLTWYNKTSKEQRALELKQEMLAAKQRDEDLMNQALGLAPRRREEPTGELEASEMKELLKRGEADRDGLVAERVEGLGAAPVASFSESDAAPKKTLAERYKEMLASGKPDTTYALPGTIAVGDGTDSNGTAGKREGESKDERRARKAAKKAARKAEKKAKKARKKERKNYDAQHHSGGQRRAVASSDASSNASDDNDDVRGRSPSPRRYDQRTRSPPRERTATRGRSRSHSRNRERRPARRDHRSRSRSPRRRSHRSRSRSPPRASDYRRRDRSSCSRSPRPSDYASSRRRDHSRSPRRR